jgi:outer membrane translocation and assembly module TamA
MRLATVILTLFVLACLGHAQSPAQPSQAGQPPQTEFQVRSLNVDSDELPQADRERVIRCLQGHAYIPGEFEERTRQSMRDLGYYHAEAEEAVLSEVRDGKTGKSANVSIKVEPGAQFRLGYIQFKRATLFPPDRLRSQFPIQAGTLFNSSGVGYGLEKLKRLYQDKGYINFGAIPIPAIDEGHHVIDLTIDMDEGKPYFFGHLIFDGVEPRAGAAKALTESWANLQGKTYNPELLKTWLKSNWPAAAENEYNVRVVENDPRQVNLLLQFP